MPVAFPLPLLQSSRGSRHIAARPPFSILPRDREGGQFVNIIPGRSASRGCGLLPSKHLVTSFCMYAHWYFFTSVKLPLINCIRTRTELHNIDTVTCAQILPWAPGLPASPQTLQHTLASSVTVFCFRELDNQKALLFHKSPWKKKTHTHKINKPRKRYCNRILTFGNSLVFYFNNYHYSKHCRNCLQLFKTLMTLWKLVLKQKWLVILTDGFEKHLGESWNVLYGTTDNPVSVPYCRHSAAVGKNEKRS